MNNPPFEVLNENDNISIEVKYFRLKPPTFHYQQRFQFKILFI